MRRFGREFEGKRQMFRTQKGRTSRLSAIAGASALTAAGVLAAAAPASATGIKAEFKGMADGQGMKIKVTGTSHREPDAGYMNLKVDGTGEILKVYCIDFTNPVGTGDDYNEGEWKDTWLGNRADDGARVKWILLNSVPSKSLADLKTAVGNVGGLDDREAGAATQAAIWHFSDHIDLDKGEKQNDPDVVAVYDWLVKNAKTDNGGDTKFSLELTPDNLAGKPSDKPGVGPFTVNSSTKEKDITAKIKSGPAGTKLVDKDGNAVTKVGDQDKLWVQPPAGSNTGEATVEVSGTSSVDAGRVFKGQRNGKATQLLILAQRNPVKVTDTSDAKWATSGALPSFTAEEKCAEGGVEITATNKGDEDFTFTLDGKQTVVAKNGGTVKQLVKVAEDQKYDIKIVGPDNKTLKEFTGVVDCKPASTTGGGGTPPTTAPAASPAPSGPELAKTGGNGSDSTLYLTGGAVLLLGGGLVFFVVRRRAAQ